MDKTLRDAVIEKTRELMDAPSCSPDTREACERWLQSNPSDREADALYIKELEEAVVPIDGLIAFASSEEGKKVFGDNAAEIVAHAKKIKAEGAHYCDCPACAAALDILAKKEEMMK